MESLQLLVPTYNGGAYPDEIEKGDMPEFGGPFVEVLVYREDGVRILLGTHDPADLEKPDIKIERRPHGWAIFLHPEGGGDPSGFVYFLDDGRSFLVKEFESAIQVLEAGADVPDIDNPIEPQSADQCFHLCESADDVEASTSESASEVNQKKEVSVRDIDDCLLIEEAYDFASDLRSLAYWDKISQKWALDPELGEDFITAAKELMKNYNLTPLEDCESVDDDS